MRNILFAAFAQPGSGKSSLAYTAKNPVVLDFDGGAYRAIGYDKNRTIPCPTWMDAMGAKDLFSKYDTVVIDTIGNAIEALIQDVVPSNSYFGSVEDPTPQGWGRVRSKFLDWYIYLMNSGKDVVFLSHVGEYQGADGNIVQRLKCRGASRSLIEEKADTIARIRVEGSDRFLAFDPASSNYCKDVGISDVRINPANPFQLAHVIDGIRNTIETKNREMVEERQLVIEISEAVEKAEDVDALNAVSTRAIEITAPSFIFASLHHRAKEMGLTWDASQKLFQDSREG